MEKKKCPLMGLPISLGRLFRPATQPQGLNYTTRDKQGVVIEQQDTGFDFTPLTNALKHYVAEYNKKTNKAAADWEALETIWVEEVERAQREIR